MKKYIFLIVLINIWINAYSQFQYGDVLIGSKFNFEKAVFKQPDYTYKEFETNVDPIIEICIIKNLLAGIEFNFIARHNTSITESSTTSNWFYDLGIASSLKYNVTYKSNFLYTQIRYGFLRTGKYFSNTYDYDPNTILNVPGFGLGYLHLYNNLGLFIEINHYWIGPKEGGKINFHRNKLATQVGIKYRIIKSNNNKSEIE